MAKVVVDGQTVVVPDTANALEACRAAGVDVPHFCFHPGLSVVGQCRMCMVEIEGTPKVQASCTVPIREGMVIHASSERARAARNATMEFLLLNHPLDCPICDQAGECKLQDNAVAGGLPVSRTSEPRRQFPGYDRTEIGPHVIADMTRCIQCTRCIRFCAEVAGTGELTFIERGGHTIVWTHEGHQLDNEWSGCAADVCPVGALTVKEFRFRKRVWWLDKTRSVCDGCEIGCNVSIEHKDRIVHRYLPRVNPQVNDFWICDYGRFRAEGLNRQDYLRPVLRSGGAGTEGNWGEALTAVQLAIDEARGSDPASVLVLGSANHATEESWLLAELFARMLGLPNVEFDVDAGPERRIPNAKAAGADGRFLKGTLAAPNARGAEAAGLKRAGAGSGLSRVLDGSFAPEVLYVADAAFSSRCDDPAFVAALRRAKKLVVHARTQNALSEAADVVLPVGSLATKEGTFVNVQGRIQRCEAAFLAPPIVRSDLELLVHLGKRWGAFDTRWTARDVFDRMKERVTPYKGARWDAPALAGFPCSVSPAAAYDALVAGTAPDDPDATHVLASPAGVKP